MHRYFETDKSFYKTVLYIVIPLFLQQVLRYGVTTVNSIMSGTMGESVMSAVELATQPYNIFFSITSGLSSGASVLIAQYWGKGDMSAMRRVFSISFKVIFALSFVFSAAVMLFPGQIMGFFSKEAAVIQNGIPYLRLISFSYTLTGLSTTYLYGLRSIEQPKPCLYITIMTSLLNAAFNYVFIFGHFGMPQMGILGLALGTVLSRIVEFLVVLYYAKYKEKVLQFKLRYLKTTDKLLVGDFIRYSIPVCIGESAYTLSLSVHSFIYGHVGSTMVAAFSIVNSLQGILSSVGFAVAASALIVMGKSVGEGDLQKIHRRKNSYCAISCVAGLFGSFLMLALRGSLVNMYNVGEDTKALAYKMFGTMAFMTFFAAYELLFLMGMFRGSGATTFAAGFGTAITYLWQIPVGLLVAFVFKLSPQWIFFWLKTELILKAVGGFAYSFTNKWIKNLTRESVVDASIPKN